MFSEKETFFSDSNKRPYKTRFPSARAGLEISYSGKHGSSIDVIREGFQSRDGN